MQIVVGVTPRARGRLPWPEVPSQCPQDVQDLVVACCASEPTERPSAKGRRLALSPIHWNQLVQQAMFLTIAVDRSLHDHHCPHLQVQRESSQVLQNGHSNVSGSEMCLSALAFVLLNVVKRRKVQVAEPPRA